MPEIWGGEWDFNSEQNAALERGLKKFLPLLVAWPR